jgi:hypothetical protein
MGETMSREQAAAKLVAMMEDALRPHSSMPRSEATHVALNSVTEKAIDLIQENTALRAQLEEQAREIERLKAMCWNDDVTLDMNSKASAILGKMVGESLDEAAQRVIDELSAAQARVNELAEAKERLEQGLSLVDKYTAQPHACSPEEIGALARTYLARAALADKGEK